MEPAPEADRVRIDTGRGRRRWFFLQLSVAFAVVSMIFCFSFTASVLSALRRLDDRTLEIENWQLASELAGDLQPFIHPYVHGPIDFPNFFGTLARFHRYTPQYHVFLLKHDGTQLPLDSSVLGNSIQRFDTGPIEAALADASPNPRLHLIRYDNVLVPFSVAPANFGGTDGYVLVLLRLSPFDAVAGLLFENAGITTASTALIVILFVSIGIGSAVFWFLTSNLYQLLSVVRSFRDGDFSRRAAVTSSNELGELAESINDMADRIVSNIDELEARDRVRRELLANISHDLRAPAAGIVALTDTLVLQQGVLRPEEVSRCVSGLAECGDMLSSMVDELFELSRLESGEVRLAARSVEMSEIFESAAKRFRPAADRREISFIERGGSEQTLVTCDPRLIARVLDNLLGNALKFTAAGGTITLSAKLRTDTIRVAVADTGSGIPREAVETIFERFNQLDARPGPELGMGLGLAIVSQILRLHGIPIEVESELGRGSVFSFELPCAECE